MTAGELRWALVVPVKSTRRGKSRIALEPQDRQALAAAMAWDTVLAAARTAGVDRVLVMVETVQDQAMFADPSFLDPTLSGTVLAVLCSVIGLNESITEGRDLLVGQGWTGPTACLPGDLPGISPAELGAALVLAGTYDRAVVADADGIGTTLLTAREAAHLEPAYGGSSYRRHLGAGSTALDIGGPGGLRRDIDRLTDLIQALHGGGLGDRTAAELVHILQKNEPIEEAGTG